MDFSLLPWLHSVVSVLLCQVNLAASRHGVKDELVKWCGETGRWRVVMCSWVCRRKRDKRRRLQVVELSGLKGL